MKFVIVSGGVVSGLGKGITSSSIGVLLKACGLRVTTIKCDPYCNVDAGTIFPGDHGECFVTANGGETDLDLGSYERFLDITLTGEHNLTTGKVFSAVLQRERRGDFLGKTVQFVPHVSEEIQEWIRRVARLPVDGSGQAPEVAIVELGGTVGDIEGMIFLESLRQLSFRLGSGNVCLVHVSLVPVVGGGGLVEQKSKPSQHSVDVLRSRGLCPDLVACRSAQPLSATVRGKIAEHAMLPPERVLSLHDVSNIYRVPLMLLEQNLPGLLLEKLNLDPRATLPPKMVAWAAMADQIDDPSLPALTIAIVGKYTAHTDAYLSVAHALRHAAMVCGRAIRIAWVDAELLEPNPTDAPSTPKAKSDGHPADDDAKSGHLADHDTKRGRPADDDAKRGQPVDALASTDPAPAPGMGAHAQEKRVAEALERDDVLGRAREKRAAEARAALRSMRSSDGVLVPGGFGRRGIEGMIRAVRFAREHRRPFLGICLGLQVAVIERARNVLGLAGANSTEFAPDAAHPVVVAMPEVDQAHMGGTMRLGERRTNLAPDSLASSLYQGIPFVMERHRHRYEVNPKYAQALADSGLRFSGVAEPRPGALDLDARMEVVELPRPAGLSLSPHPAQTPRTAQGKAEGKGHGPAAPKGESAAAHASTAASGAGQGATLGPFVPAGGRHGRHPGASAGDTSHPFFLAVQYHPEFRSRPGNPSPPFLGLVRAAVAHATPAPAATAPAAAAPDTAAISAAAATAPAPPPPTNPSVGPLFTPGAAAAQPATAK
jgi:CTP synthase (UTP-ammonia lyase)